MLVASDFLLTTDDRLTGCVCDGVSAAIVSHTAAAAAWGVNAPAWVMVGLLPITHLATSLKRRHLCLVASLSLSL